MNTQQKERLAISLIKNHNGPALASDMKSLSSTAEISFTPPEFFPDEEEEAVYTFLQGMTTQKKQELAITLLQQKQQQQ
jgi:hypothetical protein